MFEHTTVLKKETVDALQIAPGGIYVDCTLGGGGHSEEILSRLSGTGHLYAFDQDEAAINAARQRLASYTGKVSIIRSNFREFAECLSHNGVDGVDGILFDLGVSSPQLDEAERGFSYQEDAEAPLDMRMNQDTILTAYEIVNEWGYNRLVSILFRYGEEKFSKPIARKIEAQRAKQPITTTSQLVNIIKEAIPAPARRKGGHPAKRTFQALRIAVNDELQAFEDALNEALRIVKVGGRISVITFQSLEDRICQSIFKKASKGPELPRGLPVIPESYQPAFKLITRKPILPQQQEQQQNRRSRSAKLRVLEKIKTTSQG